MSDIEEAEMESAEAEAVEVIKLEAEIDRLRAELAFMRGHGIVQDNERLRAELAEANARVAEVTSAFYGMKELYMKLRGERVEANARIAELEAERAKLSSFHDMLTKLSHALARAEKAEADCKRAEAERDALRVALKPFADEYDPDLPFWSCRDDNSMLMWDGLASDLCRGDFIRARAALAPSPAGREG